MVRLLMANLWSHSKTTVAFLWLVSAFIFFYSLFQLALRNSDPSSFSESLISSQERRSRLYDKMASDLVEHGPVFLKHGETSQSLSLSDLFPIKDGSVAPVLKAANPPVRANVLYLSTKYSVPISEAVKRKFNPYFENSIWFQNSTLYHFSMFHASHRIMPIAATDDEIQAEATAVSAVARDLCPLKIILDRVVLTSTGVLLGCWQVISGTDPITIRAKLRTALPRAPEKQLYDAAILHTSFARLLGQPKKSSKVELGDSNQIQFLHGLVAQLNNEVRGYETRSLSMKL